MLVWELEWRLARRRPRVFAINVAAPAVLAAAVLLGGAPVVHQAAVLAVLVAFFGVFGGAIPLVRDADDGLLMRWTLTGLDPHRLLGERLLAGAVLDGVQLAPTLALAVAIGGGGAAGFLALWLTALGALLVANSLGALVAAAARSIAEAALFGAIAALFALHFAGVFRAADPGSLAARIETLNPWRFLHEALLAALSAADGGALAQAGAARAGAAFALPSLLGGAVALMAVVLGARWLLGPLARAHGRDR